MTLGRLSGTLRQTGDIASFRNISGQYFQNEARHDFLVEAICFAVIIITAGVSLVSAAKAVIELCRAFAQL